jgi:hypothetical protein
VPINLPLTIRAHAPFGWRGLWFLMFLFRVPEQASIGRW